MSENAHCHMVRKTRAMDLYQKGVPLTHIQQLFGHENISTTSGFYAFVTIDVLAEALETVKPDDGNAGAVIPAVIKNYAEVINGKCGFSLCLKEFFSIVWMILWPVSKYKREAECFYEHLKKRMEHLD